ncbi:MAG: hypothetical protein Q8N23_31100 [Archangium sp.]|nr:hypothetical protein [Archangium sp.]MDP3157160.1 hypothetical protein [Archangium sp.]MDP3575877.1 hypothetical protein [Archangium sp.]
MSRSVILLALILCSCRDEAAEAFARAELQHRALINDAVRPEDPRFDAVVLDLRRVPVSSKHFAKAQKLLESIDAGRRQRVRTPLALGANGRRPPRLEAQLAACARLAELAGADGGVNHRALVALETCRREAEQLELEISHPDDHQDGGEPP